MSVPKAKKVTGIVLKSQLETECASECAICYVTPKHKDALILRCKHIFCVQCWYTWQHSLPVHVDVTCPTCRCNRPEAKWFRARDLRGTNDANDARHNAFIRSLPERRDPLGYFRVHQPRFRVYVPPVVRHFRVIDPTQVAREPDQIIYHLDQESDDDDEVVFVEPRPRTPPPVIVID